MLTRIGGRTVATAAALIALTALGASSALADQGVPVGGGGGGGVTCTPGTGSCTIDVTNPGNPGTTPSPSQSSGSGAGSGGSNGGSGTTATPSPEQTLINGNCTYATDPSYVPQPGTDAHAGQKGAWYLETCPDGIKLGGDPNKPIATTTQQMVWLTNPPPPALMLPTPAALADRARSLLTPPKPQIGANPPVGSPQMVGVPTWAFLPRSLWVPVSAKAEVPGESVTATATPVSVTWDFGDGTSTVCAGPGTPFTPGTDPKASSPDCGHTYRTSSGTTQGGKFQVTATISWRVDWIGAGQAGTLNDLTTTATVPVTVQQSQAIVTSTG
jgi:hypothetical protein